MSRLPQHPVEASIPEVNSAAKLAEALRTIERLQIRLAALEKRVTALGG